MQLVDNWREILRKAWSVRLMTVAVLLSASEVAMPFFGPQAPNVPFALLSLSVTLLALASRIVAQKDLK